MDATGKDKLLSKLIGAGVKLTGAGVKLTVAGVKLTVAGVKLTSAGVNITVAGVKITVAGVSRIQCMKMMRTNVTLITHSNILPAENEIKRDL
jgi:hypothetical protein